ncbi:MULTISPECIES: 2-keto-4-pentenoate hydratase [unclassified Streptomyces]|uniref:2-keto-4-pentenoate hydratase n=1 Tax=unclassified Streptomyces TaxID=2593676 RepID=UPI002023CB82|nr:MULTISPECIES: 2-keto-4-pentenoate hydratase [unclassified Streptomyces]WSC24249.1 2-keto-4-pentenoate hydratase [Streptomyces sp. NBC_01766]WSV58136.1 2-keto-4-pentenoate hydratase [Streptomyces sp. NBC_01014]
MLDDRRRQDAAELLRSAEHRRTPVAPLVDTFTGIGTEDAYGIQLINIRRRIAGGARISGHKVGLSSPVMQQMMGVDEPDYGHLLDDMELYADRPVSVTRYCAPRIEVEVGFVLGADLPGEGCTERDVLDATAQVVPALELIDSRIADWRISIADTIADNASSAGYVIGEGRDPRELDLRSIEARLSADGELIAEGRSDAVLGDPAASVSWLARTVARFGVPLKKGQLVLPGSCTRAADVTAGQTFTADFAGLGSVSLSFC